MNRLFAVLVFALCAIAQHAVGAPVRFFTTLSGAIEAPANASPATGFAQVDFDIAAHTMRVQASFSGLLGPTTAAHIHAPPPAGSDTPTGPVFSVATQTPSFIGFPLGVTSGVFDNTFDTLALTTYRAGFVTAAGGTAAAAEDALFDALNAEVAYFNIHTSVFPGGEIRGFLQAVPEPPTFALIVIALILIAWSTRLNRTGAIR